MNRPCRYGTNCSSKNPAHYFFFDHPELEKTTTTPGENVEASGTVSNENDTNVNESFSVENAPQGRSSEDFLHVVAERGRMANKLENAAPYNIFLTSITASEPTHNEPLTVTFQELLDESLGEIESSLYMTTVLDILWLLGHYVIAGLKRTPLTIIEGVKEPANYLIASKHAYVKVYHVPPVPYATTNAKLILHRYKDGSMRIILPSANLYEEDWDNRVQSVWISPRLPALTGNVDDSTHTGESPTKFRGDLIGFLQTFKIPDLQPWIERIKCADFSAINVFLVASVPGFSKDSPTGYPYGHPRLGYLLHRYCTTDIPTHVPVVAQSSVLGFLDTDVRDWMQSNFLNSLRKDSRKLASLVFPPFKIIYPSSTNVADSHDGIIGASMVLYSKDRDCRQPWLRQHLYQWSSKKRFRTKALPHTKTYARFDEAERCLYWMLFTSANIAKNGWGSIEEVEDETLLLNVNHELGILFLPRFVINEDTFPLDERNGVAPFPMPYDVPLTPYNTEDTPHFVEELRAFLNDESDSDDDTDNGNKDDSKVPE